MIHRLTSYDHRCGVQWCTRYNNFGSGRCLLSQLPLCMMFAIREIIITINKLETGLVGFPISFGSRAHLYSVAATHCQRNWKERITVSVNIIYFRYFWLERNRLKSLIIIFCFLFTWASRPLARFPTDFCAAFKWAIIAPANQLHTRPLPNNKERNWWNWVATECNYQKHNQIQLISECGISFWRSCWP